MNLFPDHLRSSLPSLKSQQETAPEERIIHIKFFIPGIKYVWFVTEGGERDGNFIFHAYVIDSDGESWHYFPLAHLEEVNEKAKELKDVLDMSGLSVERALNFKPTKFSLAIADYRAGN